MKHTKFNRQSSDWLFYAISAVIIVITLMCIVFGAVDVTAEFKR